MIMIADSEVRTILFGERQTDFAKARSPINDLYRLWGLPAPTIIAVNSRADIRELIALSPWRKAIKGWPRQFGKEVEGGGGGGYRFAPFICSRISSLFDDGYFSRMIARLGDEDGEADLLRKIHYHVGFCKMMQKVCFVSPRPIEVKTDELGRPHSFEGPAVVYPAENDVIHAIYGWRVPTRWFDPEQKLTLNYARMFLSEFDEPREQAIIDYVGREKYIRSIGQVGERNADGAIWVVILNSRQERAVYVEVENATIEDGRRRRFMLRVPPHMTDPSEAVAWTFDKSPKDYNLTGAA